jgi:hypothetical protein
MESRQQSDHPSPSLDHLRREPSEGYRLLVCWERIVFGEESPKDYDLNEIGLEFRIPKKNQSLVLDRMPE